MLNDTWTIFSEEASPSTKDSEAQNVPHRLGTGRLDGEVRIGIQKNFMVFISHVNPFHLTFRYTALFNLELQLISAQTPCHHPGPILREPSEKKNNS